VNVSVFCGTHMCTHVVTLTLANHTGRGAAVHFAVVSFLAALDRMRQCML